MYPISEYLNNSCLAFKDNSKPLIVGSSGTNRIKSGDTLSTRWRNGGIDWHLLYIVSGKAHFYIGGQDIVVAAGNMVLYQPEQEMHYELLSKDRAEVYWVHFTGSEVRSILKKYEIPIDHNVFYCGNSPTYAYLFQEMILELQARQVGYQQLLPMYLEQIFVLIQRGRLERRPAVSSHIQEKIDNARKYFQEHYNEEINIEEYALSRNMSVSWFLRNFKQVTTKSPMQYILNIRINNAVSLLESTGYNISEIAAIVGYDNSLYFIRIFKKQKGVSPSDYRKALGQRK